MGDVIEFPGHGEAAIRNALSYFRTTYATAGLNENQTNAAMVELEPIVRSFLIRNEFEFSLHGNFTEDQISSISDAHNFAMQSAIKYFSSQLWLALCHIAGIIGQKFNDGQ
jgi:hypothetical protein